MLFAVVEVLMLVRRACTLPPNQNRFAVFAGVRQSDNRRSSGGGSGELACSLARTNKNRSLAPVFLVSRAEEF